MNLPRCEGFGAAQAYGVANCSECSELCSDYIFEAGEVICTDCCTFRQAYELGKDHGYFQGKMAAMKEQKS